ncbi:hypothetical protein [Yinghuangia soli]|uniref:Uncharacterized protein n=1 Tax=Yinghuangia soli TaxID=2908204 RepID=A0AA41Q436_9ACTN|nr:hypothetical protein [Yinghuangia soli]MCF2531169.1 hypothetical protein [Yinghuangia soli]
MTVVQTEDERAVFTECRAARKYGSVISDACARTIASWYVDDSDAESHGIAFMATGEVPDSGALFRELTGDGDRYVGASARHRRAIEQFAVYLLARTAAGPVPEWSALWASARQR